MASSRMTRAFSAERWHLLPNREASRDSEQIALSDIA
jgi:hypothetical protein